MAEIRSDYKVYKHTTPSGKVYIGITCQDIEKRWEHGKGYKRNAHFYSAIEKYGWENISHEILFKNLTKEEAAAKEIELIAKFKSNDREFGYNKSKGGEKSAEGVKRSAETRKKMSEAKKGTKQSPETIKKRQDSAAARRRNGGKRYALEEILQHVDDIEKWARIGATEEDIAGQFGVSRQTFSKYKNENVDIFNAIKRGRTGLVKELKGVLADKAKGFKYSEKKIVREKNEAGDLVITREEEYIKYSPPDVAALNLLLKNYDKENWANDPQVIELRKKELELRERQIEAGEW